MAKEKMSAIINEFVHPFVKDELSIYPRLIPLAIFAWNIGLLAQKEQRSAIKETLDKLCEEKKSRQELKRILKILLRRRKRHFSGYRKAIVKHKVVGDRYVLYVASITPQNNIAGNKAEPTEGTSAEST